MVSRVSELVKSVGKHISSEQQNLEKGKIAQKSLNNFVTDVDKSAEKQLVEGLMSILPGSGMMAEEGTGSKNAGGYNWIIDPLDGTTNFIHGIPCYAISIALQAESGEMEMGIVYNIPADELFCAWKNGPAVLNGRAIKVSDTRKLERSLIATGFPYHDFGRLDGYMNLFKDLCYGTRGLRRLGSAAIDLAYVACGRFDSFYEYGLNTWDVAAGAFIVERAGGSVTDFKGKRNLTSGSEIVASNKLIHEEFLKVINTYL